MNGSVKETSGSSGDLLVFQPHRCVLTCDGGCGGAFAGDQSHYLWFGDQAGEDVMGVRYQSAAHPYGYPQSGMQMWPDRSVTAPECNTSLSCEERDDFEPDTRFKI